MVSSAKRLRHLIVFATVVVMLVAAVLMAKSGCGRSESALAGGNPWATYLGSLIFVFAGWGVLASEALGHLFARWGWEPDFQPMRIIGDGGDEFSPGQKRWVAYPTMAIFGGVGFWQWIGVNGCDVIVVPMRGIAG